MNALQLAAMALAPALLLDLVLMWRRVAARWRWAAAAGVLAVLLAPWPGGAPVLALRGLVGDLSITSLVLLALVAAARGTGRPLRARVAPELTWLAVLLVGTAVWFYPLSLGITRVDPYAHGYYPTVLSAGLLALFIGAATAGRWFTVVVVAVAYAGYALGWLESDNLWDYLFDVPLVGVAIAHLVRHRSRLRWREAFSAERVQAGVLSVVAAFVVFGMVLVRVDPREFDTRFTLEDGFVEWATVATLVFGALFGLWRLRHAWPRFGRMGRLVLVGMVLICVFGAGEEISWGQRVFGIQTPEALAARNTQGEFNLHNLTFQWNGKTVRVNRLVFGTGLALALATYLLVISPLYRRRDRVRRWVDAWAVPIPTLAQTLGFVLAFAAIELLIRSPKRGELTELVGVLLVVLTIVVPYNRAIYRAPQPR